MVTKTLTLRDFLTPAQIRVVIRLWHTKTNSTAFRCLVVEQVLKPAMPLINEKLGQENDARYLAYAVEYAMMQSEEQ